MVRTTLRQELEASIEREACSQIGLKLGVRHLKFVSSSDTGWPDQLFLLPGGRPGLIEFKRTGEELRPKQAYCHAVLSKLGYRVTTCDSVEAAMAVITKWMEEDRDGKV